MSTNIEGKVVVITGGSGGLGEDTARLLATRGASVVLGARRTEKLNAVVEEITKAGGKAVAVKTDVTKQSDVSNLVEEAVKAFGKVDVMVNNAGIMPIAPLSAIKVEEWDRAIDVNIKGVLYGIAAALPVFQAAKQGHFINLASVAGLKVYAPGGTVYSATKFAVRAISEGLRVETRNDNIRVTIISPGFADSDLKDSSSGEETRAMLNEFYKIAIPGETVAASIAYAIEQSANTSVSEIVLRPTVQEF